MRSMLRSWCLSQHWAVKLLTKQLDGSWFAQWHPIGNSGGGLMAPHAALKTCSSPSSKGGFGGFKHRKADLWKVSLCKLEADRHKKLDIKKAVGNLGIAKQWLHALELLNYSATQSVRCDAALANSVANTCNFHHGPWKIPLQLLHSLSDERIKPDAFSCGVGMKALNGIALRQGTAWTDAYHRLLAFQKDCSHCLSVIVWGTVLDTMGKAAVWKMAVNLLRSMGAGAPGSPNPDSQCVNVVITSGNWETWRMSLVLLSADTVDEVSFNSAIVKLRDAFNAALIWGLLSRMRTLAIEPSEVTYGTAANGFGSASLWSSAFQSLTSGMWASTAPNIVSFGACLNASQKSGTWRSALKLLDALSIASLQLNAPCAGAALNSCGICRQWSSTFALLQRISDLAIGLSMPMLGAAMAACQGAVDDPDFLDFTVDAWPDANGKNANALPTLWERALSFYHLPETTRPRKPGTKTQAKLAPDPVTIGIGVSACGKGEQWPTSLQLLEFAKLHRVEPSPTILNSVLDGMDRAMCWTQSLAMLALFEQERLALDSLSFRSMIQASEASSNCLQNPSCKTSGAGTMYRNCKQFCSSLTTRMNRKYVILPVYYV